ncbi:Dihydroorotate dehydrogenase (quinone) [Gossypium arboreum]|uniref:Dihydroorotate dehydrogenase (Quinone) n=1 Tax=Gossypium arboreum TaxID=29729 RepID=A0A0B0N2C3_GOSAR|nr:Dihydroorotate dehydrogenase (quinone) [Gossypium arboreum]
MLRYQWEDAIRFWNSKKGKDRKRVGITIGKNKNSRTQMGRKEKLKDKRAEYEAIASSDSSVNLDNIDNRMIEKFWVLKSMVEFDFKDLLLTQPNILDPAHSNTCLWQIRLKLKFRG